MALQRHGSRCFLLRLGARVLAMHYGWNGQHEAIVYGGQGYRYGTAWDELPYCGKLGWNTRECPAGYQGKLQSGTNSSIIQAGKGAGGFIMAGRIILCLFYNLIYQHRIL